MPGDLGERIFEPFVSGAGSSGLGLSVSRQIAEAHGGTLSGGNHPGGGAEFCLCLPGPELGDDEAVSDSGVLGGGCDRLKARCPGATDGASHGVLKLCQDVIRV